jgi:hypothetical protein
MSTVTRFEHPTDKKACQICKIKPIQMLPTLVDEVGACVRCGMPYVHHDVEGHLLQYLKPAIDSVFCEMAVRAWLMKVPITMRPFLPPDPITWDMSEVGVENALEEGLEPGHPCLTDFEKFVADERAEWTVNPTPGQAIEVFESVGKGDGAHWLRHLNSDVEPQKVEGLLTIAARDLAAGSQVIVIRKGATRG